MNDVLEEMANLEQYKDVKFAKVEAENIPEVSIKSGITVVPTILLLKNCDIIDRVDGANAPALTEKIKHHLKNEDHLEIQDLLLLDMINNKKSLKERLKKLVNQAPCMLFMKGNPANPRCGYSKTIVSILDKYKTDYKSFDILQDNDVREGLKKFSNWPTYPQLYVNGQLIGGLDIVKEMDECGELESMLPKNDSTETK